MKDYKLEKFISQGLMGKVYLVSKNNKKYAMKIEYIASKKDSILLNELKLIKEVASKNPDQFMQLIDWEFIEDCKEPAPEIPDWVDDKERKYFVKLRQSGLCVRKFYTLIDDTLSNFPIGKMTMKERYSMMIQLLYINYLIQSNGFVHGDFHHGNIGVINVDKKKNVIIFGKKIPTFGNQFVAIDYGGVLHKDTLSSKRKYQQRNISELQHYNDMKVVDKSGIIKSMVSDRDFWEYMRKNNITTNDFEKDLKLVLSQPEISLFTGITKETFILWDLYRILFTKKFQQLVLGKKFKKYIPNVYLLPVEDILYSFINLDNDKKLIEYFIARLENL